MRTSAPNSRFLPQASGPQADLKAHNLSMWALSNLKIRHTGLWRKPLNEDSHPPCVLKDCIGGGASSRSSRVY